MVSFLILLGAAEVTLSVIYAAQRREVAPGEDFSGPGSRKLVFLR
jgi:hypothetical protein